MAKRAQRGPYLHDFGIYRPVEWQPRQLDILRQLMRGFMEINPSISPVDPAEMRVVLIASGLVKSMAYESPQLSHLPTDALQSRISGALPRFANTRGTVTVDGLNQSPKKVEASRIHDLRLRVWDDQLGKEQAAGMETFIQAGAPDTRQATKPFILLGSETLPKDIRTNRQQWDIYRHTLEDAMGPGLRAIGDIAVEKVEISPPWIPDVARQG